MGKCPTLITSQLSIGLLDGDMVILHVTMLCLGSQTSLHVLAATGGIFQDLNSVSIKEIDS